VTESGTLGRLEAGVVAVAPGGQLGPSPVAQGFVAFGLVAARESLLTRSRPRVAVPRRLGTMVLAGDAQLLVAPPRGLSVAPTQDRILAAPDLDVPVYEYLARLSPERFLPGVGEVPEDAITLLETNPRFIEALLVGLNHEMNRELLWQAFPTDQRGTPFRRFWSWSDGQPDIPPIHLWPAANALGANSRSGAGGQIALLVRGRLLRRYPNTAIYAWRARGSVLAHPPSKGDIRSPVFSGVLADDIVFVGFDLTEADLLDGDGWFFVLQQQPTEPRFGFDEPDAGGASAPLAGWRDATWAHAGTASGRYLRIDGNPLAGRQFGGVRFVDHAAHLATLALQSPMRVALHARSMLTPGGTRFAGEGRADG
jgi:hypothetical protein